MNKHTRGFYAWRALSQKVLAVAKVNVDIGDFAVYIDAVPGDDHDAECAEVAASGAKTTPEIAKVLFPAMFTEDYPYRWRPVTRK